MAESLILSGTLCAEHRYHQIRHFLCTAPQLRPSLAVILIGEDGPSVLYVKKKKEMAESLGFESQVLPFSEHASEAEIVESIHRLNADRAIHGIMLQLPTPALLARQTLLNTIASEKDVDGLSSLSLGCLLTRQPGFIPCTALGCLELIHQWRKDLAGLHAVIIGQSILLGKPLDFLLLHEGCTVTLAHSRTQGLARLTQSAHIVVSAVGKPGWMGKESIAPGACLIDVGITTLPTGHVVGDFQFNALAPSAAAITPVPGGVGPLTVAYLMLNTLTACLLQNNIPLPDFLRRSP